MTSTLFGSRKCLTALVCVFAFAALVSAQDADILGSWEARTPPSFQASDAPVDVSGTWLFQVETGAGSGTPTMTFKQDGGKLSGHYSGQLGEATVAGTVKGNAVEFSFDVSIQGTDLHIVYSGTAEKDSMKGKVALGDLGEGTFTAKKKS